mgnify:FL=1
MSSTEPRLEHVHSDARGDIYRLLVPPKLEIMLFRCKAGFKRGGHRHTAHEVVSLLSGRMNYHKVIDGQPQVEEKLPGAVMVNKPDEPHMGEFLEDSWVIEWKYGPDGGIGDWQTIDYEPLRAQTRPSTSSGGVSGP